MEESKCTIKPLNEEGTSKKMSYEELEAVAHQLSEQLRQLYSKLQMANMSNTFKRLDYLFKIIEHKEVFKGNFVDNCISEIEDIITIPEQEAEDLK